MTALLTEHLATWIAADTTEKSARGRSAAASLYGVKKLRELILELAVRGLLVPQNPDDEPASELLKKIAAEKAQLVKEGKIKAQKPLAAIGDDEKPFELPKGWEWVKLDEVGHDWGQKTPNQEFTYIDVGSINKELGLIDSPNIIQATDAPSRARKIVKNGTVIYSTVRPYLLNIAVIECDFTPEPIASTAFAIIHPFSQVVGRFLFWYLRCPVFIRYVEGCQTGIAYPAINDKQFFSGLMPLPPLAEQQRIVTKVDELMALCDQLEQQQNNSQAAHQHLVSQLLNALTQAANANDFQHTWQRIASHFDVLFTTEDSINQLKQSILQLAVMGKLVPQNPNDEPASQLLKKIAAEKAQLVKEGKIKTQKPLPPIGDNEMPFELPMGWEWVRLGSISRLQGGMAYQSGMFIGSGKNQVIRMGNVKPWRLRLDEKSVFIDDGLASVTMEYSLQVDDIVITMTGTIGKRDYVYSARVYESDLEHKKLFLNQRLCLVSPHLIRSAYLDIVLKDDRLLDLIFDSATGTANQANIGMSSLNLWTLPLPPLAEQQCIVTKIDELMALCDQLKNQLNQAKHLQGKIADVLVEQALA